MATTTSIFCCKTGRVTRKVLLRSPAGLDREEYWCGRCHPGLQAGHATPDGATILTLVPMRSGPNPLPYKRPSERARAVRRAIMTVLALALMAGLMYLTPPGRAYQHAVARMFASATG